ncbi:SMP-30/gluconolactonase/LRE family protein [Actinocrispum wychmicini]|uniref:Sugar lactone lactonase YvrE n=1 Tax=Actinocrispum wychmicini TaxID=1213861 RepID=A0A4R2J6F0_9PSEU|nr:SMP-30/gluconolactonase/LRE family protein [Actinocrispum wychmicini]TCO53102.1 sugar lactone lactonase YvrE [Actinocrispum wychmicini]
MKTLLTGLGLVESPRWRDGLLWFADWSAGEVITVDLDGNHEVVARVDSLPLCIDWLPDGHLLIVDSPNGRLLRRDQDGTLVTRADLGKPGWNDIVVDGRGNAYVNCAGFNPMAGEEFKPGGVYLANPDGCRQVADDIAFPNGMAVVDDVLIVADSYGHALVAFDIQPNGDLANRRIWADLGSDVPDGICVDRSGAVWYADVPHKRCVRVASGGKVLDTVDVDRGAFACALNGSTLFVVAAEWQGMTEKELVRPGSGQVIAVDLDTA